MSASAKAIANSAVGLLDIIQYLPNYWLPLVASGFVGCKQKSLAQSKHAATLAEYLESVQTSSTREKSPLISALAHASSSEVQHRQRATRRDGKASTGTCPARLAREDREPIAPPCHRHIELLRIELVHEHDRDSDLSKAYQ